MPRRLTALALLLLLAACASAQGLRPGADGAPPSGGMTMLYPQKPEAVLEAAIRSLPQIGLHVVEVDAGGKYLLAERGVNAMSNGENVGVYLAPSGTGTSVTVLSRRKTATNIGAKDFTMPVHMQLGATLGRLGQPNQAGQPALPRY
ncbi:MAG: hypothetical protein Q8O35_05420 [Humidesulfovibrio sp.]|uniref:hypothetical protein n=1 Tax=Humidesulfovibrio sp. TaxID=2910988 RepID=UPI0027335321|nr:hypothetical protein [Humidesulfovibrio sp.]MDP2847617.1 hypothetical protein [Humidesulfovibrio sp.]